MENSGLNVEKYILVEREGRKARQRRLAIFKSITFALTLTVTFFAQVIKLHGFTSAKPSKVEVVQAEKLNVSNVSIGAVAVQPVKAQINTIYNADIPIPREHQEYLYKLCKERGLDYNKMLAIIKHESVFDATLISETDDYGYMQINKINHKELANKLNTQNKPLDPYININWGTYMMSNIYSYWEAQGYTGSELDKMAWSEYNKGRSGVKKSGLAKNYVAKVSEALVEVNNIRK